MTAAVGRPRRRGADRSASTPRTARAPTTGSCWSSRLAAKEAGRGPGPLLRHDRRGHAGPDPRAVRQAGQRRRMPVETHCHNDLGMAVANSVSGALGDLDAGQDAWVNTCVNGIGERAGNADLLSCILAFRHGFGVAGRRPRSVTRSTCPGPGGSAGGRATRSASRSRRTSPAWAATRSRTSPASTPTARSRTGRTTSCTTTSTLGPFPDDWFTRAGRVVLTGEYGGKAGFRHVHGRARHRRSPTVTRTWRSQWCSSARRPAASR